MAGKKIILCDSNIFIALYRGQQQTIESLTAIEQDNIAISAVTAGELLFGARNKKELATIKKDIAKLQLLPINEDISAISLQLIEKYCLSHKLSIPDALIAATALYYNIKLYTLNLKDFTFIPNLILYRPAL
jgi:tRNA(fMet)-specific endonuclease VapC